MSTIGCCSVNLLMQIMVFLVLVQHACLHFGIVDRLCALADRDGQITPPFVIELQITVM